VATISGAAFLVNLFHAHEKASPMLNPGVPPPRAGGPYPPGPGYPACGGGYPGAHDGGGGKPPDWCGGGKPPGGG